MFAMAAASTPARSTRRGLEGRGGLIISSGSSSSTRGAVGGGAEYAGANSVRRVYDGCSDLVIIKTSSQGVRAEFVYIYIIYKR